MDHFLETWALFWSLKCPLYWTEIRIRTFIFVDVSLDRFTTVTKIMSEDLKRFCVTESSQPIPVQTTTQQFGYNDHSSSASPSVNPRPGLSLVRTCSDSPDADERFNDDDLQTFALTATQYYCSQIVNSVPEPRLSDLTDDSIEDQPIISQAIIQRLGLVRAMHTTMTIENSSSQQLQSVPNDHHPYPPVVQSGTIHEHDRPFAEYGHLGKSVDSVAFDHEAPCALSIL